MSDNNNNNYTLTPYVDGQTVPQGDRYWLWGLRKTGKAYAAKMILEALERIEEEAELAKHATDL